MNEIVICSWNSNFDRATLGLLGAGQKLASQLNTKLRVVVIGANGESVANQSANFAENVQFSTQTELVEYQPETYLNALTALLKGLQPRAVLLSNDTYSQEIAPRLAHRLNGSAGGDALDLEVADEQIHVTRSAYGGKALAVFGLKKTPAVVWVRSRSWESAKEIVSKGEIALLALEIKPDSRTQIIERKQESAGEAKLEDARLIISGGRGLGGSEPFAELQKIADILGGQVAASRAACDSGWVSPTLQVGQTGKKVAPELYVAVALSGASQHLAGMSDSKTIAAINTDKDAPIFKHCRFGIVEDYKKVLPLLREKLAEMKQ